MIFAIRVIVDYRLGIILDLTMFAIMIERWTEEMHGSDRVLT